jgi:hypothetical protein
MIDIDKNILALREIVKYEFSIRPHFLGTTKRDGDISLVMNILNEMILEMLILKFLDKKVIKKLSDDFISLLISLFDYGVDFSFDILNYYETAFEIISNYSHQFELWEVASNIKNFRSLEFIKIMNEYE